MNLYEHIVQDGPRNVNTLSFEEMTAEFGRRRDYIKMYGYSVPNHSAVKELVHLADSNLILEVGAGLGLWSRLLKDEGANCRATDHYKVGCGDYSFKNSNRFTDVECFTAEDAVGKYDNAFILLASWPCYKRDWFTRACKKFKGEYVVHIGEGWGGCTADDSFFDYMENKFTLFKEAPIPQWNSINDTVQIYKRKEI